MNRSTAGSQPLSADHPAQSAASPGAGNIDDEIINRFRLLVTAHRDGTLHQTVFVRMILQLEADLARPHGFVITASNTDDDWTVIALRMRGRSDPCAAFEILPGSGQVRQVTWP